jgi:hypothetical protein
MGEDQAYQKYPIKVLETSERATRKKTVRMCKVQWSHHTKKEATWEQAEDLKMEFPDFFVISSESQGRDSF